MAACGKLDVDAHSLAAFTLGVDSTAVIFHNRFCLCQTQTISADAVGALIIQLEDMGCFISRKPFAIVF